MTISSISNYAAPAPFVPAAQAGPVGGAADPDGDGDGGGGRRQHVHRSHGGGQAQQALMQALQSLGFSVPQASTSSGATKSGAGPSDSSIAASTGTGNIKHDMHDFMHALFQAVKAENTLSSSTPAGSSSDPKSSFAAGLSALIKQVSNGGAPAGIQDAFNKLVSDLQPGTPAVAAAGGSTGTVAASSQPSLQSLLWALQQDLGYGRTAGPSGTGNVVSAQA